MVERPNRLTVGVLLPVHNRNPRENQDFQSALVLWQVYETPYAPPFADDPPEPVVFAGPLRREPDEEGRQVYSATVRPGLVFSDGVLVEAAHVAASLMRARAFTEQAQAEVRGDRVFLVLRRPHARFEVVLTQTYCAVVREEGGELLGSGPYVFAPESTPELVRLRRNPHYRDAAQIEEVDFRVYPPDAAGRPTELLEATKRGDVDFTSALSREDLAQLRGVRKWFEPGCSTAILFFNAERPYLAAPEARRALALALSRTQLARISYSNALAFRASGLLPPMMGNWRDGLRHDTERAAALLAERRRGFPEKLRLLRVWGPRPYLPHPRLVSEAIALQLQELGVAVEIEAPPTSTAFYERVRSGDYDLVLAGWIADTPDPADFLESVLASTMVPVPGDPSPNAANQSRYRSPAMDAALARFRTNPSSENREDVFRLLREDVPLLPLMYGPNVVAHSWRVRNFRLSPLGIPFFHKMRL